MAWTSGGERLRFGAANGMARAAGERTAAGAAEKKRIEKGVEKGIEKSIEEGRIDGATGSNKKRKQPANLAPAPAAGPGRDGFMLHFFMGGTAHEAADSAEQFLNWQ